MGGKGHTSLRSLSSSRLRRRSTSSPSLLEDMHAPMLLMCRYVWILRRRRRLVGMLWRDGLTMDACGSYFKYCARWFLFVVGVLFEMMYGHSFWIPFTENL